MMRPYFAVKLLVGDVFCRSDCAGTCIVDQDIDAAEFLQDFRDCCVYFLCIRDINRYREGFNAVLIMDLLRDFLDFVFTAGHRDDDRSLICERFRHLDAKSAGASGNDRNAASQIKIIFH